MPTPGLKTLCIVQSGDGTYWADAKEMNQTVEFRHVVH